MISLPCDTQHSHFSACTGNYFGIFLSRFSNYRVSSSVPVGLGDLLLELRPFPSMKTNWHFARGVMEVGPSTEIGVAAGNGICWSLGNRVSQ